MKHLINSIKDLFSYIGSNYNNEEDLETILFRSTCNTSQSEKIKEFDFTQIIDSFGDSLKIRLFQEKGTNSHFIKKGSYNKQSLSEDIEDMIAISPHIDMEITILKDNLINTIFEFSKYTKYFNIRLFTTYEKMVHILQDFSYIALENQIFDKRGKTVILFLEDNILLNNGITLFVGGITSQGIENYIEEYFELKFDCEQFKYTIEKRNDQSHWIEGSLLLCPEYLYFDFDNPNFHCSDFLKNYLLKLVANLIIPFLANFTSTEQGKPYSIINGHKKLKIDYLETTIFEYEQVKYLYKQYKWAYGDKNSDKLSVLRNLTSIFLCEDCNLNYHQLILNKSQDIYKSILANFDIYLKENVKQYFLERNKVSDTISGKAKDIATEINSIIENITKSFLASVGIILGGILGYVSKTSINILKIAIILYMVYIITNGLYYLTHSIFRKSLIKNDYNNHINKFKQILIDKDIPIYKTTTMYKSEIAFYVYWWVSLILIFVLLTLAYISLLNIKSIAQFINSTV